MTRITLKGRGRFYYAHDDVDSVARQWKEAKPGDLYQISGTTARVAFSSFQNVEHYEEYVPPAAFKYVAMLCLLGVLLYIAFFGG